MINQPWDPKRPLEGPQGQAQLRCVLPDRAGPSAPRGASRSGAAARRPPGTRAAGSWRCSALPRTSAARRARAPHCAAHSSRVSGWGCQAGGGRRHGGGGCGNSSLEGRETGAEGGGRQFRSAKGWTEVSVAKGQCPQCRLCFPVWKRARRDPTQRGAPSRIPTPLTPATATFQPTSQVTPSVCSTPTSFPFHKPLPLLSAPQFRGQKLLESGFTKLDGEKSKAKETVGRPQPRRRVQRSLAQRAGGDLGLAGGRCRGRSSHLGRAEKIPHFDQELFLLLFVYLLTGAEVGSWTRAEHRKTPHSCAKDKPWVPSPGTGAQGAGAPLTGRTLCSREKVKRIHMLLPTVGNSFHRCLLTVYKLGIAGSDSKARGQSGGCALRLPAKAYRKRTQWVTNHSLFLQLVDFPDPSLFDQDQSHLCHYECEPLEFFFWRSPLLMPWAQWAEVADQSRTGRWRQSTTLQSLFPRDSSRKALFRAIP